MCRRFRPTTVRSSRAAGRWLLGTCVLLNVLWRSASGAPILWSAASGGNDHYYDFVNTSVPWTQAKTLAESATYLGMHGYLATITSAAENTFIASHTGAFDFWIGLTDSEAYGGSESKNKPHPQTDGWVWVTGEPVSYVHWNPGEPNDETSNEDGVEIYGTELGPNFPNGDWNDEHSTSFQGYVVEYGVPEPSELALASAASICMLLFLVGRFRMNTTIRTSSAI